MIFKSCIATPSTHNERVISCENSNNFDALGFEFFDFLDVRRDMIYVACRLEKILLIEKIKTPPQQLTVKAPGTEIIRTFLPFHSLVDNVTADRLIVSN